MNEKATLTKLLKERITVLRNESLIELLLKLGVAMQPEDLNLALRSASPKDIIGLMLAKGASINGVLKDYGTPIQTLLRTSFGGSNAVVNLQGQMLEVLVGAGCDPNLDSPECKATPLQIVCARSKFAGGIAFLSNPPFEWEDNESLAVILLRVGAKANLTAVDIPGEGRELIRSTPLELACVTGKAEVIRVLLDAGADVNSAGGGFGPPLQAACMRFGQKKEVGVDIVKTLLAAGAAVNAVSKPCGTALAAATHSLLPEVVKVLLDAGADLSLKISEETNGEYRDARDALCQRHGRLVENLQATFNRMQTESYNPVLLTYDTAGEKWDRIKGLLTQYGTVHFAKEEEECPSIYRQERFQNVFVEKEYMGLSPEEIRWRDEWRPGQGSSREKGVAQGVGGLFGSNPLPGGDFGAAGDHHNPNVGSVTESSRFEVTGSTGFGAGFGKRNLESFAAFGSNPTTPPAPSLFGGALSEGGLFGAAGSFRESLFGGDTSQGGLVGTMSGSDPNKAGLFGAIGSSTSSVVGSRSAPRNLFVSATTNGVLSTANLEATTESSSEPRRKSTKGLAESDTE